jgi:hypothetical protein
LAALYTDEDIGPMLVSMLRRHGHQVTRTVEALQSGNSDADQLAYAVRNQMILVTHNADHFRKLNEIWRSWVPLGLPDHPGILAIPQARADLQAIHGYDISAAARLISELLASGQQLGNQMYRWRPSHGWLNVTHNTA